MKVGDSVVVVRPILYRQRNLIGSVLKIVSSIRVSTSLVKLKAFEGGVWLDTEVDLLENITDLDRLIYGIKDDV